MQQIELHACQLYWVAVDRDRASLGVQAKAAELQHAGCVGKRGPAQPRLDASEQFLGPEGFSQVIVRPQFERTNLV